jgi:hypothetical protein
MEHNSCICGSCRKVVKKPIVVTNFVFAPRKETYYACPYCLTKIEDITEESNCEPVTIEEPVESVYTESEIPEEESIQPENSTSQEPSDEFSVPHAVTIEKLETLEKERTDLLAELEELREGAAKKLSILEEEVVALREEAELLRKMTET